MSRTTVTRTIHAPVDRVFRTVADIGSFSKAVPGIVSTEILSEVKSGVGTRFRETRMMRGKETTTELEVTEFVENDHVRIVADVHGTVWDSIFTVKPAGGQTELTLTMDANAYNLTSKMMNPMIIGVVRRALEDDMQSVKDYCENEAGPTP